MIPHIEPNECKIMMRVIRQKFYFIINDPKAIYSTVNCILDIEIPILFTYLQTKETKLKENTTENKNMNPNSVHSTSLSFHALDTLLYVILDSVSPMLNGFRYCIQPGWIKLIRFA